jgi:hypothetical protein
MAQTPGTGYVELHYPAQVPKYAEENASPQVNSTNEGKPEKALHPACSTAHPPIRQDPQENSYFMSSES